jgi:hypothetical protein
MAKSERFPFSRQMTAPEVPLILCTAQASRAEMRSLPSRSLSTLLMWK